MHFLPHTTLAKPLFECFETSLVYILWLHRFVIVSCGPTWDTTLIWDPVLILKCMSKKESTGSLFVLSAFSPTSVCPSRKSFTNNYPLLLFIVLLFYSILLPSSSIASEHHSAEVRQTTQNETITLLPSLLPASALAAGSVRSTATKARESDLHGIDIWYIITKLGLHQTLLFFCLTVWQSLRFLCYGC